MGAEIVARGGQAVILQTFRFERRGREHIHCRGGEPDGTMVMEFERTAMFLKRLQV